MVIVSVVVQVTILVCLRVSAVSIDSKQNRKCVSVRVGGGGGYVDCSLLFPTGAIKRTCCQDGGR